MRDGYRRAGRLVGQGAMLALILMLFLIVLSRGEIFSGRLM